MVKGKILLLSEGPDEVKFFDELNKKVLGRDNLQIVSLRCNIYSLFSLMKDYDFDIDLEKALLFSKSVSDEDKEKIKGSFFPSKFLVFDFDFQEDSMDQSSKFAALKKMIDVFDNDSVNGLLLINYPMFESIKEPFSPKKAPEIVFDPLNGKKYKRYIAERGVHFDIGKLTKTFIDELIVSSLSMCNYIINNHYSITNKAELKDISAESIERKQEDKLKKDGLIFCVNTSVQLPYLYFGDRYLRNL